MSQAVDRILHIADLHFWKAVWNPFRLLNKRALGNLNVVLRRGKSFDMEHAFQYIDAIAQTGIQRAIFTGDFSSTSLDEEFAHARSFIDAVRARGIDTTVLPGNHDVYTFESVRKQRFEKHFRDLMPQDGMPSIQKLPGGTPLIAVPTVCPNVISSQGRITDAEVARVCELVATCEGPILVAAHYPLLAQTSAYTLTAQRELRNAGTLRRALGETDKPILYLCGHVHRFSYTQDPDYPALQHLTTGALFHANPAQQRNGEFTEIHTYADRFAVFNHVHTTSWSRIPCEPG